MLHISFDGLDMLDEAGFATAVDDVIVPFRAFSSTLAFQPNLTLAAGNARIAAFAEPDAAWRYACAILEAPTGNLAMTVAGHYALAHWFEDPPALVGRGVAELALIASSAMPGVLTASETLVSALFAGPTPEFCAAHIGEIADLRLFSVTVG